MMINANKVKALMEAQDIEVMLVNSPENFIYTSGIYDSTIHMLMKSRMLDQFTVVPKESEPVLLINSGALENAEEMSWIKDIRTTPNTSWLVRDRAHKDFAASASEGIARILQEKKLTSGRIGIEKGYISFDTYEFFRSKFPRAQFCDIQSILQDLRAIKTDNEIAKIKQAIKSTERGYEAAMASIAEGITDFDIAKAFRVAVAHEGDDVAHLMCGVGAKGGVLFTHPCGSKVKEGDIIRFDLGTVHMGYRSDLSRTAVLGEPSERLLKLHRALLEAQQKGIKEIKPGTKLCKIHEIIKKAVRDAGYTEYTRGMFGHSVGLETEEQPMITASTDAVFEPNMVFTVEVSWYEPAWGGMNIEDMIVVTKDGCEELSTMPRDIRAIK